MRSGWGFDNAISAIAQLISARSSRSSMRTSRFRDEVESAIEHVEPAIDLVESTVDARELFVDARESFVDVRELFVQVGLQLRIHDTTLTLGSARLPLPVCASLPIHGSGAACPGARIAACFPAARRVMPSCPA
jgi:hypothetical protein